MSHIVIVDTDILIDAGRGVELAVNYLRQSKVSFAISVVTKMELIVGCRNKTELHHTDRFLHHFQLFSIDELISLKTVELLSQYRLSHGLLIADAFIAATAIIYNLPLVSKNQRDYRFIENLNLLSYP